MGFLNANKAMASMWGRMVKADQKLGMAAVGWAGTDVGKVLGTGFSYTPGRVGSKLLAMGDRAQHDLSQNKLAGYLGSGIGMLAGGYAGSGNRDDSGFRRVGGAFVGGALGSAAGMHAGLAMRPGTLNNNLARSFGSQAYRGGRRMAGYYGPGF